jgi:hypothetical protein
MEEQKAGKTLTQKDVDRLTGAIMSQSSVDGYLDHVIRAVEDFVIKKRGMNKPYRISKRPLKHSSLIRGQGFVYIYIHGATLKYSSEGNGIDKRFAIAHELGHIMFHFHYDMSYGNNSRFVKDAKRETQASYFAKCILNNRTDLLWKYGEGIMPLSDERIKMYCQLYDPKLLLDD